MLKKADIPLSKRAGELTEEDTEKLITIMQVNINIVLLTCSTKFLPRLFLSYDVTHLTPLVKANDATYPLTPLKRNFG